MTVRLPGLLWSLAAWGLTVACCAEAPVGSVDDPIPRGLPTPTGEGWASLVPEGSAVATVGHVMISRRALNHAMAAQPDLPAREVLRRLVELEALAQEAHRQGIRGDATTRSRWRQAMVFRYLKDAFEGALTPESIPQGDVDRVFQMPQIRKIYDHADSWRMAHLFVTCCDPKTEECDTEEVLTCFQEAARVIDEVWSDIKPRATGDEGHPEDLMALMQDYRLTVEDRYPQLAYRDRAFYYDPRKPHGEQKGYNVLAEVVARTVIDAPHATLQEPVQSPFGWHILARIDHVPESRKGPDDLEVSSDIRKNLFPKYREARFRDLLGRLSDRYGATMAPAE